MNRASLLLLFGLVALQMWAQKSPAYVGRIADWQQFQSLSGKPFVQKYGNVQSLKVAFDLRDSSLYFISSAHYTYHFDFCAERLGFWESHSEFNIANYSESPRRRFCLGNVNHYSGSGLWALELSPADDFPEALVLPFLRRVRRDLYAGDSLRLLLNTRSLELKAKDLVASPDHWLSVNDIYAGIRYQPLHQKSAYGYLRTATPEQIKNTPPGIRDIVFLQGEMLDIPPVAGLLTTHFQTPLSHLCLLAKNRGTPFLAHRGLDADPRFPAWEGQLVYFAVQLDSFVLRPATLAEAQAAWAKEQVRKPWTLAHDLSRQGLVPMTDISLRSINMVGGKAANFGVLHKLARKSKLGWKVPEGSFAIPFYYYMQHMDASGASAQLRDLLADPDARANSATLRARLADLRKAMLTHPVDARLLALVDSAARTGSPSLRMRFRSSTNAEDIPGFNGAGLYESRTGTVGDTAKSIEKAIRRVWASAWSFEAFQEREFFRIDHAHVAMGLLVHRSFPTESANGVAITKNLYRKGYFGFVINVQAGETSVVDPPDSVTCDQLICYSDTEIEFFRSKRIVEFISRSSLTQGEPVLSEEQVERLTIALAELKRHYYYDVLTGRKPSSYYEYALDVEFKFDGEDGQLYIKQVRPFRE